MTEELARKIIMLRIGNKMHSMRRISEIMCDEHSNYIKEKYNEFDLSLIRGHQWMGEELYQEACELFR